MKEINLEEILLAKIPKDCYWEDMGNLTNCPKEYVLDAMLDFGKQLLELAAENAELKNVIKLIDNQNGAKYNTVVPIIKKQSILDTINQIK